MFTASPDDLPAVPKVDILIVDDNVNNVVAVEAMLEPLGQNLVRADSGREALRHLLERDFALVLLDIQMPVLDGFETAQIIRSRDRTRTLPIIFLTAFSRDEAQIARAYELGAVAFLWKPIIPMILRSKVSVFVELHRKTLEVKRQASILSKVARHEHDRQLSEVVQRAEAQRLREEVLHERSVAATLELNVAASARAEAALQVSNAELLLRNAELAEADHRKDQFLVMLAHELRNPMAPIVGATALLRAPDVSPAVALRSLDALDRQVAHMARLVDDLLDLSRVTTGKIELRRGPVTLSSIVRLAVETSAPFMARGGHRFDCTLPDPDITLHADGDRLSQVIANLLNNAAKFSPQGNQIALLAEREGDELVIKVRDLGIGISPELLGTLFRPFVQLDRANERAQGGLGVGLVLVKSLVELHGGSVTAFSAGLGKGSEFSLRVPIEVVAAAVASSPTPEGATTNVHARARRVVVVEDNEDTREMMKDLIGSWGYEVATADDGPSGVEVLLSFRPDIAFVDVGLPGCDGYELIAAARERLPDLGTRLVALTGYGSAADHARALAAGFDFHVVKPVSVDELVRLLELPLDAPDNGSPIPNAA